MAGAANPGLYAELGDAWDDLQASIGQIFTPILKAAIPIVRALGDAFATLGPFIEAFIDGALTPLMDLFKQGMGMLGLKSSVGKAAGQAGFSSSDSFAQKVQLAAFSSGGGAKRDTPTILEDIFKYLMGKDKAEHYTEATGFGPNGLMRK